jgi:hypothetical protein
MAGTIFGSPLEYLACCGVLFVAQAIYVLFGFGAGLIAVGGLALIVADLRDVVVLLLLVSLPAELSVVVASRRRIRWRAAAVLGAGIVAGIPLGTAILRRGEPSFLLSLLGATLVGVGLIFLVLPRERHVRWPVWSEPPLGLLSGTLTGLFGTGGPPLIVYYHLAGWDKAAFRGQLMALFLMMTFVRVPAYVIGGLIDRPRLISGLAVLPAVAVGAWVGQRIHVQLSEITFRRLVSIMLALVGLLLLLRPDGVD